MATIDSTTTDHGTDTTRTGGDNGARAKVTNALGAARTRASSATQQVGTRIEDAPIAALVGGLAVGAAIGALLPRTQREAETLGPIGHKIGQAATEAARAAIDAGKAELGLNQPAKSPVEAIMDKAIGAVSGAATAAGSAAASKVTGSDGQ